MLERLAQLEQNIAALDELDVFRRYAAAISKALE